MNEHVRAPKGITAKVSPLKMLSTLLSRTSLGSFLGKSHSGDRDLYEVFGYPTNLLYEELLAKYTRQNIASRIVDAPPAATWSADITLDGGTQAFNRAWEKFAKEHKVWAALEGADRISGIGQYGVLLIGFDDGGKTDRPVNTSRTNKVLYMRAYTQQHAKVLQLVSDPLDKRFGLPLMYEIKIIDPSTTRGDFNSTVSDNHNKPIQVHYSRVLHLAENPIENDFIGTPRLQQVYNDLMDLLKVSGGSAEVFWLNSNRGMQIDVDKEMDLSPEDATALEDEVQQYQHELRRIIRTRGVEINNLGADSADPKGTFEVIMSLISGSTGIPQRILLGSEAGHLASDQDRANWAERIQERRTDYAEPFILDPFINLLVNAKALPKHKELEVDWPSAFVLSPLEVGQQRAQDARAVANLSKQFDGKGAQITSREEARELVGLEGDLPESDLVLAIPNPNPNTTTTTSSPANGGTNDDDEDAEELRRRADEVDQDEGVQS